MSSCNRSPVNRNVYERTHVFVRVPEIKLIRSTYVIYILFAWPLIKLNALVMLGCCASMGGLVNEKWDMTGGDKNHMSNQSG